MTLIPASFGGGVWSNGDGMVVEGPGLARLAHGQTVR
jgi:hypothetical protein